MDPPGKGDSLAILKTGSINCILEIFYRLNG